MMRTDYPGRWTHHVLIPQTEEIDEKLMERIRKTAAFSEAKGRKS